MIKILKLQIKILKSQCGQRLDLALAQLLPQYSRSVIKKWILNKSITINGFIINKPKKKILGNEKISINTYLDKELYWNPENIPLDIIYEDEEILVINKPQNLVVHPGSGNISGTLLNGLLYYYPNIINIPRAGIVNRLDKDTTGLMIIAKTKTSQKFLVNSFKIGSITREYEAIVNGNILYHGTVNKPIARHYQKRTRMAVNQLGKKAITHYKIIEKYHSHTRIRIKLQTGRTHQIRVHMAYIKHPVLGDPIYSSMTSNLKGISKEYSEIIKNFNRQALHAIMLKITHPVSGKIMQWTTRLPEDMLKIIEILKINNKNKF